MYSWFNYIHVYVIREKRLKNETAYCRREDKYDDSYEGDSDSDKTEDQ